MRIDVPFRELTEQERDIVFHGPAEKRHIIYQSPLENGPSRRARFHVFQRGLALLKTRFRKAKDEKGLARVAKFLKEGVILIAGNALCRPRPRAAYWRRYLAAGKRDGAR